MARLVAPAVGMLILILDGQTALLGASEGVALCIRTIIPSLFPFFVLSSMLNAELLGRPLLILRPFRRLCAIPQGAETVLAVGLMGGYPVGGQCISSAWRSKHLSKEDAERMLGFCNNAGPAFLFGILGPMFPAQWIPWGLWIIHMVSALIVGILTRDQCSQSNPPANSPISLTDALNNALKVTATVCGWVILFRITLAFLNRWALWMFPTPWAVFISGILELSNGCVQLHYIENTGLRMILASVMLALGGLCVTMQTHSVTKGLSLKHYVAGKIMQAVISLCFIYPLQWLLPDEERFYFPIPVLFLGIVIVLGAAFFLRKSEKRGSITTPFGV